MPDKKDGNPSDDSTANLDALIEKGQKAIAEAEETKRRVGQLLAGAGATVPAADELRCPGCYTKAFRPYPISKGDPEFSCLRDDCQTQFRVLVQDGRIVKVETLN